MEQSEFMALWEVSKRREAKELLNFLLVYKDEIIKLGLVPTIDLLIDDLRKGLDY